MLDNPVKTTRLLTALKAALPFEVELAPSLIALLKAQHVEDDVKPRQIVSEVSYAGDEGGIVCHLQLEETEKVVVVSLTYVLLHRSLPLAAAVFDYQKHRVKKLKRQSGE
jgi:hypothetical protein